MLKLYLELQQMRFKDLHFEIETSNIKTVEQIKIPTMLIQPYVENAILHGLSHSLKNKELKINFTLMDNVLKINVLDNGIGRVKSAEINALNVSKPKSFATKANLERIILLNKEHYKIDVKYIDLTDENNESKGTQVVITIKI